MYFIYSYAIICREPTVQITFTLKRMSEELLAQLVFEESELFPKLTLQVILSLSGKPFQVRLHCVIFLTNSSQLFLSIYSCFGRQISYSYFLSERVDSLSHTLTSDNDLKIL